MVFSATFNNISVISWLSDLLMEKARVPGENHDLSPITDKLLNLQLPMQSVPITTLVEFESRLVEVYSIQHYVINFVSDLRKVVVFSGYSKHQIGVRVKIMVCIATFNNISVISWQSDLLVDNPEKTTYLPQVTDKLYQIMSGIRIHVSGDRH
jgi:hypothetical protein